MIGTAGYNDFDIILTGFRARLSSTAPRTRRMSHARCYALLGARDVCYDSSMHTMLYLVPVLIECWLVLAWTPLL